MENGEPSRPKEGCPSSTKLIPGRLDDLHGQMADLRSTVADLRSPTDRRLESLDRRWTWSLGPLATMMLALLAQVFLPGA